MKIFEDDFLYIEIENSDIPWLKIFTKESVKELSDLNEHEYFRVFKMVRVVEIALREFYNPTKINIASFGNYLQRVHVHIQARFENDPFFPESMWGKKQRENNLKLPKIDEFATYLSEKLKID